MTRSIVRKLGSSLVLIACCPLVASALPCSGELVYRTGSPTGCTSNVREYRTIVSSNASDITCSDPLLSMTEQQAIDDINNEVPPSQLGNCKEVTLRVRYDPYSPTQRQYTVTSSRSLGGAEPRPIFTSITHSQTVAIGASQAQRETVAVDATETQTTE